MSDCEHKRFKCKSCMREYDRTELIPKQVTKPTNPTYNNWKAAVLNNETTASFHSWAAANRIYSDPDEFDL